MRTESRSDPRDASEQHLELLQREPLLPAARQQQVLARHALAGHLEPALPAALLALSGGVAAALGLPLPRQLQPQQDLIQKASRIKELSWSDSRQQSRTRSCCAYDAQPLR